MRKFIVSIICALCVGAAFATGENVATSKAFVDTNVAQKQDKISANSGTAQVLTNTGEQGTVGTKEIYDSSAAYSGQKDSLVDAQTMNAAVQNAIDAEFRCIKWVDNDQTKDCLLVEIRSVSSQTTLPAGYTALEYIESTGEQWINTNIWIEKSQPTQLEMSVALSPQNDSSYAWVGANAFMQLKVTPFYYAVDSNVQPSTAIDPTNRNTVKMDYTSTNDLKLYVNGTYIQTINWTLLNQYTHTKFCIFNLCNSSGESVGTPRAKGKVYNVRLSVVNTLVLNAIPARRDSDGEVGMFDTVSNTFLTNSGTGDFVAGPDAGVYMP